MKNWLVVCFSLLCFGEVFAQERLTDARRNEFESQKIAFFTRELDLSPEEAAVFWPVYNEMQKKNRELEGMMWKNFREMKEAGKLSEARYRQAIDSMLVRENRMYALKEKYYRKMLTVLPASKVWKLGEAERKFHRCLFNKLCREPAPRK